jgi:hypothetical protein
MDGFESKKHRMQEALCLAVYKLDVDTVLNLLSEGVDCSTLKDLITPLMLAVSVPPPQPAMEAFRLPIIESLVAAGSLLGHRDSDGNTAADLAFIHKRVDEKVAMVLRMKTEGVVIYTMEGCGPCHKMKSLGHGIEMLMGPETKHNAKSEPTLSNSKTPEGYPCIDFGHGNIHTGSLPIVGGAEQPGLYDLFLQFVERQRKV